jgi:hypothetical protein
VEASRNYCFFGVPGNRISDGCNSQKREPSERIALDTQLENINLDSFAMPFSMSIYYDTRFGVLENAAIILSCASQELPQ